jgi:uncharacterized membrane protein YeaQ/YmgE (transglycosylase-associated protein family)
MSFILLLIGLIISGLFWGSLARLALPGPDPMTIPQTIMVGIGGSLLGGMVGYLLTDQTGSLFFSFLGSFAIVYIVRRSRGGSLTDPGPRAPLGH